MSEEVKQSRKTIQFLKLLGTKHKAHTSPSVDEICERIKSLSVEELTYSYDEDNKILCLPWENGEGRSYIFVFRTLKNLPHYVDKNESLQDLKKILRGGGLGFCSFLSFFEGDYVGYVRNDQGPTISSIEAILRRAMTLDFEQKYGPIKCKALVQRDTRRYIKRLEQAYSFEVKVTPQEGNQLFMGDPNVSNILNDIRRESDVDSVKLVLSVEKGTRRERFTKWIKQTLEPFWHGEFAGNKADSIKVEGEYEGELSERKINVLKEEFKFSESFNLLNPKATVLDVNDVFEKIRYKFAEMEDDIRQANLNMSD